MARRMFQLLVCLMVAASPLVVAVAPARADNASALLGLVNSLRAAHGVGPLAADPTLTSVAQSWSAHMASVNTLSHNPNVAAQVGGGWTKLGENVGKGGSINGIYNAFVNSSFHLGNMLDPTYNLTGVAVVVGPQNTLWVTQDFEAKPGATPVTTLPPPTTPTTVQPVTTAPPTTRKAAPAAITAAPSPPAPSPTTPPPTLAAPAPLAPSNVAGDPGVPGPDLTPTPTTPTPTTGAAKLAAASHQTGGGSPNSLALTLSALAVVLLSGAAFAIRLLLRAP